MKKHLRDLPGNSNRNHGLGQEALTFQPIIQNDTNKPLAYILQSEEPVFYNVQLVGDSMLLRLSKFIERISLSTQRRYSRWDSQLPRTPLRNRSLSTPRNKINISEQIKSGGSLSDIFHDSTATSTDCESPVSSSSLTHLKFGFKKKHFRHEDTPPDSLITNSPMIRLNETPKNVNIKPSRMSSKDSPTTELENAAQKVPSDTNGNSPMLHSSESPASQLVNKTPMMYVYDTPPTFSSYGTHHEVLARSAPPFRNEARPGAVSEVIRLCVSGQTLFELFTLLSSTSSKPYVDMPEKIVLMCGTNDIKRRNSLSSMTRMMKKVIQVLKTIKADANITVLTLPPIPAIPSTQQTNTLLQFNKFLLEELEGVKTVDIYPLFMTQGKISTSLFEEFLGNRMNRKKDGVHWNAKGMGIVHQHLIQRGIFQR